MKCICSIYRSPKQDGMYLYVEKQCELTKVPEALLKRFGRPELAMTLLLHTERKLARVDVEKVLQGIDEQGYFLQMPPQPERYMSELHEKNVKM